jgi:hypothetical protein
VLVRGCQNGYTELGKEDWVNVVLECHFKRLWRRDNGNAVEQEHMQCSVTLTRYVVDDVLDGLFSSRNDSGRR